ncbi:MAG: LON peptidase substrate-binding domain-containing protein [Xanthomonadales bacterium]|jgi:Lon protease-like protein|nr:LON peptidase substrate-binding domain-containing protein [Xanthomonadales bacterium]
MSTIEIPLFPLRTVLFPGAVLPLRIFEQRYLTMIRDCAQSDTGFGVCLIREGEEAVSPVKPAQVGTHAQIVDWYTLDDGLFGVSTFGTARFVTEVVWQQDDGLFKAQISVLPEPPPTRVPAAYSVLSDVLARFIEKAGAQYPQSTPESVQDATWVGYRLSELLPLSGVEKQHLLELMDPIERLQQLLEVMPRFQTD